MTKLKLKKYKTAGDLAHEYNPLLNQKNRNSNGELKEFRTKELAVDLQNPVNIECQSSYDGTVNLILNDDKNPPRIINTRFTTLENNTYKIVSRNQIEQSNIYKEGFIDQQTRLFRNLNTIPQIDLRKVETYGQLKCGNYTFYIKYADSDDNLTDIVAESGVVSITHGEFTKVQSISGGLLDERTNKAILLQIQNVDTTFQTIYVYYVRETSDTNGVRLTKAAKLKQGYSIKSNLVSININGFEEIEEISPEELNIKYNCVESVKTQAQVQNMLFFGNVQANDINITELQNISLFIDVSINQREESVGWIKYDYSTKDYQSEYYNPLNTYYYLGYWPGEIYRLGIVYIFNDDTLSPVFNLRGKKFNTLLESNLLGSEKYSSLYKDGVLQYVPNDEFIAEEANYANTKGVFCIPDDVSVLNYNEEKVNPIYFKVILNEDIVSELQKYKVKGYFIVRQKRIPITLAQAFSIGVDRISHTPMLKVDDKTYISESFLSKNRTLTTDYSSRKLETSQKQSSGLLCLDANVVPELQTWFDGSEFLLKQQGVFKTLTGNNRQYYPTNNSNNFVSGNQVSKERLVYVNSDVPLKYVNSFGFSTRAGAAEEAKQFAFFDTKDYEKENYKLLRGVFAPFIGVCGNLEDSSIYNIRTSNNSNAHIQDYMLIRARDNSPYFAITDRYSLNLKHTQEVYRGDCYTATVTIRMQRNFIDSNVPTAEHIVDPDTWENVYEGLTDTKIEKWSEINIADLNTVPIGTWVTFKVLSNYNLGLRSIDNSHSDEIALMGNARKFYPLNDMSVATSNKIEESWLLNGGYSSTLGVKRNFIAPNVPYLKDVFDTRVMFSNVEVSSDFKNGYRIFQGLSYKDLDRQYGAIVKLISWGSNLLCVFEHGIGIIPINEKALLSTTTGQSIHLYGSGVLQEQISLITSDFGSIWQDSIVKTTVGIYGVDTFAKKIWRYSNEKGLELLSDTKIQSFLNENVKLAELDKYPILGLRNVKTHFNNNKGDVIFTFYNESKNTNWSICYNERLDKWITRYSWMPLFSENIDNQFFTLDKKRAEVLSYIYYNKNINVGLRTKEYQNENFENVDSNIWKNSNAAHVMQLIPYGYEVDYFKTFAFELEQMSASYYDESGNEIVVDFIDKYKNEINKPWSITPTNNDSEVQVTLLPELLKINNILEIFYLTLKIRLTPYYSGSSQLINASSSLQTIGVVLQKDLSWSSEIQEKYDKIMQNGFYVHGRAGIFDEINYNDYDMKNQILPTRWYDKQEPFEFEFVVNNIVGAHKIFNDLVIISNNVQPKELEFEIIGDVYDFNKAGIYKAEVFGDDITKSKIDLEWNQTNKKVSQEFINVDVKYDNITNKYSLVTTQPCYDIKQYGRRKGNIHYKEDAWYVVIEPIKFKKKYPIYDNDKVVSDRTSEDINSTRIRDKFLKIRVKYSGEDLAIISNLRTLMTLSYA